MPMIVSETKLVKVRLQILWRDGMESSVHRPLELTPKAFDGIGVDSATDVFIGGVLDGFVDEVERTHFVVDVRFIRGKYRAYLTHGLKHGNDGGRFRIFNHLGFNPTFTFNHSKNNRFAFGSPSTLSVMLAADIGFVSFDHPAERVSSLFHQQANLFGDPPRAFVGDSDVPLNLHSRHAVLGLAHQEDGMEPGRKARRGFVEDRTCRRIDLISTPRTDVSPSLNDRVEASLMVAFQALRSSWEVNLVKIGKAGNVIWELLTEVFDCVFHLISPVLHQGPPAGPKAAEGLCLGLTDSGNNQHFDFLRILRHPFCQRFPYLKRMGVFVEVIFIKYHRVARFSSFCCVHDRTSCFTSSWRQSTPAQVGQVALFFSV